MGGVGDDRYLLHVQSYNNGRWQSYVSIRFDAFRYDLFSSSSDAPRAWQAPRRRARGNRGRWLPRCSTVGLFRRHYWPKIGHHSAHSLPREVGIHKFGSAYVRSKDREKHGNDGLVHVFRHLREQKRHAFGAFSQAWHRWRGGFTEIVFHILLVVK